MDKTIEIFGKRLKIVTDEDNSAEICEKCAVKTICWSTMSRIPACRDAKSDTYRHFEEVID